MKADLIQESEMKFGQYDIEDLFYIEKSKLYKELGTDLKTVEFILRNKEDSIIFLEAKKSCPNEANKNETQEKADSFEKYYSSITEKFMDSFQIYLALLLKRYSDTSEVGENLCNIKNLNNIELKFVLVIKTAKDLAWLAGPKAILENRLMKYKKIWKIEIAVLNQELARKYNLIV